MDFARQAVFAIDLNNGHQIEPQQSEVGEIILRKSFAGEVSVNAAKAAKTVGRNARPAKIRHLDLLCGADHYVFDLTFAVEEHADLTARFVTQLGHLPRQFGRNDFVRRDTTRGKLFDTAKLIVFQPACKTRNFTNKNLRCSSL
jgi:hypothetical protein